MASTPPEPRPDSARTKLQPRFEREPQPPPFFESRPFLRQLFYDRRFAGAFVVAIVLLVIGGLSIPRIWRCTPEHFQPVIRRSVLDRWRASSLDQRARQLVKSGNHAEARGLWLTAQTSNPGAVQLVQGYLQAVIDGPSLSEEQINEMEIASRRLLKLSQTNLADLSLVAEAHRKQGFEPDAVTFLLPFQDELTREGLATLLKSLFEIGYGDAMGPLWARLAAAGPPSPEMSLYFDSWSVGWGPATDRTVALSRLTAAASDPATAPLAAHLALGLAEFHPDVQACQRSFEQLVTLHRDRLEDHIRFWRLLVLTGRRDEARQRARAINQVPRGLFRFGELVRVLVNLDLAEDAHLLLDQQVRDGPLARRPRIWALRASLLSSQKRWDDLRALALQIRSSSALRGKAGGYGWFLEGVAEHRSGRRENAIRAFENMVAASISDPVLGLEAEAQVRQLGYLELATKLLADLENRFESAPEAWFEGAVTAFQTRQVDTFRLATERGYRLRSTVPSYARNFALALVSDRSDPALAIRLTEPPFRKQPTNFRAALDFAQALLQAERIDEAAKILEPLTPALLPRAELNAYHLANLELAYRRGLAAEALTHYALVDTNQLFDPQRRWLETTHQKLANLTPKGQLTPVTPHP